LCLLPFPFAPYREHIAWLELGELSALGNDAADPTGKAGKKKEMGVCLEVETIQDAFGRMKAGVLSFSKCVMVALLTRALLARDATY
jgi:hypothetical protein